MRLVHKTFLWSNYKSSVWITEVHSQRLTRYCIILAITPMYN